MTYQKAITDAATGETRIVDLTPEEIAEIEAKQARAIVQETFAIVDLPTDDEIRNATKIADLKDVVLKQNAALALLAARLGLKG